MTPDYFIDANKEQPVCFEAQALTWQAASDQCRRYTFGRQQQQSSEDNAATEQSKSEK